MTPPDGVYRPNLGKWSSLMAFKQVGCILPSYFDINKNIWEWWPRKFPLLRVSSLGVTTSHTTINFGGNLYRVTVFRHMQGGDIQMHTRCGRRLNDKK
jgi:hypothetical protein